MLVLRIDFLTGRYVATEYNDRSRAEWPPHPARIFSALVATHYAADVPDEAERRALEWLEAQNAPELYASPADRRDVFTVFVPVNDTTMTGNFESDADALASLKAEVGVLGARLAEEPADKGIGRELKKAEKALARAQERLQEKTARAVAIGPAQAGLIETAARVLPENRGRQPRTFPVVIPEDPVVYLQWPSAIPEEGVRSALDNLAKRVVRLGHSSSLVSIRLWTEAVKPTHVPSDRGQLRLRVVRPGQLRLLGESFALHKETEPRLLPAAFQTYGTPAKRDVQSPAPPALAGDWIVYSRSGGSRLRITAGAGLAATFRRALMTHAAQPAIGAISGHAPDGSPTTKPHVAFVPLPYIGGQHADGGIMGLAVVVPSALDSNERRAVFQALATWEEAGAGKERSGNGSLAVHLGTNGVLQLTRIEGPPDKLTLDPLTWIRPARRWLTATPVALDRNPGDLRTRDPAKLGKAVDEAREILCAACERQGLPAPDFIEILPAAPWPGAAKVRHYPAFPSNPDRTQRVLTHVAIEFGRPVMGPLILGAGRYLGLGLFRPVREDGVH